jgi:two-component system response regulator CpxR
LYDMVIAMQAIAVEDAVAKICEAAENEEVRTSPQSLSAADDFILASQVELALVPKGYDTEVRCSHGEVTIFVHQYVSRLEPLARQLSEIALQVPGVKSAHCVPGTRFVPPSLLVPSMDVEPPPKKILLVDDEREFVHTLSERLQSRSLESAVVYDGEQALSFVATEEPEVMVLDLKMPGIDGIEVLRRIKRDHPRVEVIILTGHGSKREEELAKELGAFAYLRKPVDIELLTRTMKEAYRKVASSGDGGSSGSDG